MDRTTDKTTHWTAMRRDRGYLPETLTGNRDSVAAQLEEIVKAHGANWHIEVMTDQIDVYLKRKIAVYMA